MYLLAFSSGITAVSPNLVNSNHVLNSLPMPGYPPNHTMLQPTELCLVRHGETDWNLRSLTQGSTNVPLNDTGRDQARATAETLAEEPWDVIISSPLDRAYETASIIAQSTGFDDTNIVVDSDLVERGYGAAEGISAQERKQRYPDKVIPGAEPWDSVHTRVMRSMRRIATAYAGKRVIVVSHGGAILNILEEVSGGKYARGTVVLRNAGMNLLRYDGSWSVVFCNRPAGVTMNGRRAAATTENCH